MAQIIIERPSEWAYQSTSNSIYIDGEKVGVIIPGKTLQYDTTPGKHTVVAKSKWGGNSKPVEVEVDIDECKTIKLTAVKYTVWIPFFMPIIAAIIIYLISIFFKVDVQYMHFMFGFIVLYLLYFFTFGKDTFWKMEELESPNATKI